MTTDRRIVVLMSGSGSLLQALLDAARVPDAEFTIAAVITDNPQAAGLQRAEAAQVPTVVVPLADYPDRAAWDAAMAEAVVPFDPQLVVAAGFMRLLGESFLRRWGDRTINSHPALLPAFPGAHAVRDALAYGVRVTGTSIILIDAGVDAGPIVAQHPVAVRAEDTEASLHERIKVAERVLLVQVVTMMLGAGWRVEGRRVTFGERDK